MRTPDERTPIEILRDMSDNEVMMASMVVLPAVLALWSYVLSVIINGASWYWCLLRFVLLVIVAPLAYYQCVTSLRKNETEKERLQRERKILVSRLLPRKGHSASIEKLASIDAAPTRELTAHNIQELITIYPGYFASITIKSKSPNMTGKPGVKLLGEEEEVMELKIQEAPQTDEKPEQPASIFIE